MMTYLAVVWALATDVSGSKVAAGPSIVERGGATLVRSRAMMRRATYFAIVIGPQSGIAERFMGCSLLLFRSSNSRGRDAIKNRSKKQRKKRAKNSKFAGVTKKCGSNEDDVRQSPKVTPDLSTAGLMFSFVR